MTTVMSTVVTTKPSVTSLDTIAQNTAQSPRANMYPTSNSTTPSKEYPPTNKVSLEPSDKILWQLSLIYDLRYDY